MTAPGRLRKALKRGHVESLKGEGTGIVADNHPDARTCLGPI